MVISVISVILEDSQHPARLLRHMLHQFLANRPDLWLKKVPNSQTELDWVPSRSQSQPIIHLVTNWHDKNVPFFSVSFVSFVFFYGWKKRPEMSEITMITWVPKPPWPNCRWRPALRRNSSERPGVFGLQKRSGNLANSANWKMDQNGYFFCWIFYWMFIPTTTENEKRVHVVLSFWSISKWGIRPEAAHSLDGPRSWGGQSQMGNSAEISRCCTPRHSSCLHKTKHVFSRVTLW